MNLYNRNRTVLITGATGFVGRHFLDNIKDEYKVYALARRSRIVTHIPYHKNVQWLQCDIANKSRLNEVKKFLVEHGGIDYIFHLAAYYDFTYKDNPEYDRTNVEGTKNILELAKDLDVKRFVFISSLAACEFPQEGEVITEKSPPDATFAYARSKKIGEELTQEYSNYFPCTIIRLAAVFSDWCEYAPLYKFLTTWLSKKLESRILAGKGESAVPYLHINDLITLFRIIIKEADNLSRFGIYSASPNGSVSHKELFKIATTYYYGKSLKPVHLPKPLIYPALFLRNILSHLTSDEHFERFWMIKYVDKKLTVDSTHTQIALRWQPTPRNHITRRLLFLLEKMKSHPDEWRLKNEAAMKKVARRTNFIIYDHLTDLKETIVLKIEEQILS
ncbi:MAG: NAD(P)-dependent oxidoreductase, partial [Melioribacteraceae bacterium]|nr:NAD(P)-dependent oxidoreductase [Melioribacteraceae bacterium]